MSKLARRVIKSVIKGIVYGTMDAILTVLLPVIALNQMAVTQVGGVTEGIEGVSVPLMPENLETMMWSVLGLFIGVAIIEYLVEGTPLTYVVRGIMCVAGFALVYMFLNGGIIETEVTVQDYVISVKFDASVLVWVYCLFFVVLNLVYIVAEASASRAAESEGLKG